MDWLTPHVAILSFPKLYIGTSHILIDLRTLDFFDTQISWTFCLQWMLRVVDKLSLDRDVFVFDILMLNWYIFNCWFRYNLWDVTSYMLYCVVVRRYHLSWNYVNSHKITIVLHCPLLWNYTIPGFIHIINYFFLYWYILYPAVSFNHISFNFLLCSDWAFRFRLNIRWTSISYSRVSILSSIICIARIVELRFSIVGTIVISGVGENKT